MMNTSSVTMEEHPAAVALLKEWNGLHNLAGRSNVPAAPVSQAALIADLAAPCKIIVILQSTQKFFQLDQDKQTNHTFESLAGQTPEALAQIIVDLSGMIDLSCKPTVEQLVQDDIVAKFELYLDILRDVRGIIEPAIVVNPQASMVTADASMAESAASDSTVRYHDIGPDVQPATAGAPPCVSPAAKKTPATSATPSRSHAQGRPMTGTPGRHAAGAGGHPPVCPPSQSAARATRAQTAKKEAQQVQQTNAAEDDGTGAVAPAQGFIAGVFNSVGSLFSPAPQPRASVAREPACMAQPAPAPVDYGELFAEVKNDNAMLKVEAARLKALCEAKDSLCISLKSALQAAQAGEEQATALLQAQKEAYAALEEQRSMEASAREVEALGYQDQILSLRDEVAQGKSAHTSALAAAQQEKEEALAQAKAEAAQALELALQAQADATASQLASLQAVLQERDECITALGQEVQAARESIAAMQESMAAAAAERDAMSSSLDKARTEVSASLASAAAEVSKLRHECAAMKDAVLSTSSAYAADMTALGAQLNRAVAAAQKQADEANSRFAREQSERRRLWNRVQELRGNIRVFVRVRPLLGKEAEEGAAVRVPTPYEVAVAEVAGDGLSGRVASKVGHALEFDRVFSPEEGQAAVYEEVQPLVTSAMDGYHATVFAYGQTGAGKSFTMEGPTGVAGQASEGDLGVYARSLRDLFAIAAVRKGDGWTYTIKASMVEIYNEKVRDLLAAGTGGGALVLPSAADTSMAMEEEGEEELNNTASSLDTTTTSAMPGKEVDPSNLQIRPTSSAGSGGSVSLVGATWVEVSTAGDVAAVMAKGHAARFVRATNMNEHSSRSHCLLMVTISGSYTSPEGKSESVAGKLTLVDLAGSERLDKSGAEGQAKTEAANINTSLFWLGNVLNKLGEVAAAAPGERERMKVPYKESKLTHLLKDSLDRQGKVAMIAQVSPVLTSRSETVSTLQFAAKVKRVELGKAVKVSAPSATSTSATGGAGGTGGMGAPGGVSSAEFAKVRAEAKKEKERADKAEAEAAAAAARAEALSARVSSLECAPPAPLPEAVVAAKVQAAVDAAVKKAAEEGASKTKTAVDAALRRAVGEAEEKYKSEVASLKRALTSAQAKHEAEVEAVRRETRMAVEREHKRKSMAPGAGAAAAVPSTKAVKAGGNKSVVGSKGISLGAAGSASSMVAPAALLPLSAGSTLSSALPSLPSFVGFAALQEEQQEDVDATAAGCDTMKEEVAEAAPTDSMPPAPSASEASGSGDGSLPSAACAGISSSLITEQEAVGGAGEDEVRAAVMINLHKQEVPGAAPEAAAVEQTAPVQDDVDAGVVPAEEVAAEDAGGAWGRGSAVGLPSTGHEVQGAYVTPPAAGMPAAADASAAAATVTPVAAPTQRTPAGAASSRGAGHTPAAAGGAGAGKRTPGLGGPVPGLKVTAAAAAAISARLASGGKNSRGAGKGTPYKSGKAGPKVPAGAGAGEEEEEGDGAEVEEDDSTAASHATPAHVKDKSLLPRHRAAMAGVPTPQPVGILKRSRAAQARGSTPAPGAPGAAEGPATKTRKTGAAGGGRVAIKAPGDEAPTDTCGQVPGPVAAVPVVPLPPLPLPLPPTTSVGSASPFPTPPATLVYAKSMGVAVLPGAHSTFGRQPGVPLGMGLLPLGMVGQGPPHAGAAPSLQTLMGLHTAPQTGTAGTSTAEVSAALLYTSQAAHAGSKRPGVPLLAVPAAAPLKMSRPALAPSTSGGATRVRVDENTAPAAGSTMGVGGKVTTGQASKAKGSAGPLMARK